MKKGEVLVLGFLVAITLSLHKDAFAQRNPHDPGEVILAQLEPIVRARYGDNFYVDYAVLDSLIGRGPAVADIGDEITDPYGTLHGCVLFWAGPSGYVGEADEDDSTVVGIFRNGALIWDTGPTLRGAFPSITGGLLYTGDLNANGNVEVCMEGWEHQRGGVSYMWIFSWNGSTGTIINDMDTAGSSRIVTNTYPFELFDYEGDEIKEIRAYWSNEGEGSGWFPDDPISTRPYVVYSWNGTKYGIWPSTPQVSGTAFLPANQLSVSTTCSVTHSGSTYAYAYRWTNSASSKQRIDFIYFPDLAASVQQQAPARWETGPSASVEGIKWQLMGSLNYSVKPGQSKDGFGLISAEVPSIIKYCVQGQRPDPDWLGNPDAITLQMLGQDIRDNSNTGYTVAPRIPPASFDGFGFLDTITSYIDQSRALGWITSDQAKNKYLRFVDTAKAYLQANIRGVTKARLDSAILSVYPDSLAGLLTSEACALIRFNAEYVLNKLREEDR